MSINIIIIIIYCKFSTPEAFFEEGKNDEE